MMFAQQSLRGRVAPEAIPQPLQPDRHAAAPLAMTALAFLSFTLSACDSPEAGRSLGGGPGADVKNWGQPVEMHAGAEPYHDTPCVTEPVECHGPLPVFGTTPPPD
jgi:hypothetical protein